MMSPDSCSSLSNASSTSESSLTDLEGEASSQSSARHEERSVSRGHLKQRGRKQRSSDLTSEDGSKSANSDTDSESEEVIAAAAVVLGATAMLLNHTTMMQATGIAAVSAMALLEQPTSSARTQRPQAPSSSAAYRASRNNQSGLSEEVPQSRKAKQTQGPAALRGRPKKKVVTSGGRISQTGCSASVVTTQDSSGPANGSSHVSRAAVSTIALSMQSGHAQEISSERTKPTAVSNGNRARHKISAQKGVSTKRTNVKAGRRGATTSSIGTRSSASVQSEGRAVVSPAWALPFQTVDTPVHTSSPAFFSPSPAYPAFSSCPNFPAFPSAPASASALSSSPDELLIGPASSHSPVARSSAVKTTSRQASSFIHLIGQFPSQQGSLHDLFRPLPKLMRPASSHASMVSIKRAASAPSIRRAFDCLAKQACRSEISEINTTSDATSDVRDDYVSKRLTRQRRYSSGAVAIPRSSPSSSKLRQLSGGDRSAMIKALYDTLQGKASPCGKSSPVPGPSSHRMRDTTSSRLEQDMSSLVKADSSLPSTNISASNPVLDTISPQTDLASSKPPDRDVDIDSSNSQAVRRSNTQNPATFASKSCTVHEAKTEPLQAQSDSHVVAPALIQSHEHGNVITLSPNRKRKREDSGSHADLNSDEHAISVDPHKPPKQRGMRKHLTASQRHSTEHESLTKSVNEDHRRPTIKTVQYCGYQMRPLHSASFSDIDHIQLARSQHYHRTIGYMLPSGGTADANGNHSPMLSLGDNLFVCSRCMKYFWLEKEWSLHEPHCERMDPPGVLAYRKGDQEIWEVRSIDNDDAKVFVQSICLLGSLFLESKYTQLHVDPFNCYLLRVDSKIVGFFTKEMRQVDNFNLSCIVLFPPFRGHNYASLLIEFSYEVSARQGVLGTPERPLSPLGLKAYNRFWAGCILRVMKSILDQGFRDELALETGDISMTYFEQTQVIDGFACVTLGELSRLTNIKEDDVGNCLREIGVFERYTYQLMPKDSPSRDSRQMPDQSNSAFLEINSLRGDLTNSANDQDGDEPHIDDSKEEIETPIDAEIEQEFEVRLDQTTIDLLIRRLHVNLMPVLDRRAVVSSYLANYNRRLDAILAHKEAKVT